MMRSVSNYSLKCCTDIRAVWRGIDQANIHTCHYAVVLEFTHDDISSTGTQQSDHEVEIEDKFRYKTPELALKILEIQQKISSKT